MKKIVMYIFCAVLIIGVMCSCNDNLDINQVYSFDLVTMPVQKKIVQGETAEIRCELIKEGDYEETRFFIRFFQVDGQGKLQMENGTVLLPNDLYPLDRTTFRLYYTSLCTDQQVIDIYIESNQGQVIQKTFSWQNDKEEEEPLISKSKQQ